MSVVALYTKVACKDGIYLRDFLLKKGFQGYELKIRSSSFNANRIELLRQDLHSFAIPKNIVIFNITLSKLFALLGNNLF